MLCFIGLQIHFGRLSVVRVLLPSLGIDARSPYRSANRCCAAYPNWHQLFVNGQKDTIRLSISTSTQKVDISRSTRELKKCPPTYANSSVLLGEKNFFILKDNCHIASADSVSCRFLILPCKFNRSERFSNPTTILGFCFIDLPLKRNVSNKPPRTLNPHLDLDLNTPILTDSNNSE